MLTLLQILVDDIMKSRVLHLMQLDTISCYLLKWTVISSIAGNCNGQHVALRQFFILFLWVWLSQGLAS